MNIFFQKILRVGFSLMTLYWALFKVVTVGVRVVIEHEGKILLIKYSYRDGYHFPGGSVGRTEEFIKAGTRQVFEKTNLVVRDLHLISVYRNHINNKSNCVLIYRAGKLEDANELKLDDFQVEEAIWVDPANPPKGTSYYTKQTLSTVL